MQTGRIFIRCKFKIVKTISREIWEGAKRNGRCSIQGRDKISRVCNGGHEGRYCICGKYSEPIYIKDKSTVLDAHETYYEVFERAL